MACGDEIPITIEYRRVWFPAGTLVDPVKYCVTADDECCGSGSGVDPGTDPPCCTGEYVTDLIAEFVGPFGEDCAVQTRTVSLVWDTEILAWEGTSDESESGDYVVVSVWCDSESFFGSVDVYRGGVLLTTFELAPTASGDGTTLVESVDAPGLSCDPNTVTVEIEHPCPSADCFSDCTEVSTDRTFTGTITNKVGVCACLPDTISLVYELADSRWEGTTDYACLLAECEENVNPFLRCNAGAWEYLGYTGPTVSCVDGTLAIVFNVTPFWGGSYTITFTLDPL